MADKPTSEKDIGEQVQELGRALMNKLAGLAQPVSTEEMAARFVNNSAAYTAAYNALPEDVRDSEGLRTVNGQLSEGKTFDEIKPIILGLPEKDPLKVAINQSNQAILEPLNKYIAQSKKWSTTRENLEGLLVKERKITQYQAVEISGELFNKSSYFSESVVPSNFNAPAIVDGVAKTFPTLLPGVPTPTPITPEQQKAATDKLYAAIDAKDGEAIENVLADIKKQHPDVNLDKALYSSSRGGEYAPLGYAASIGNQAAVEALIAAGAKVDAEPKPGWSPLVAAVNGNHKTAVDALLAAGGNPNAQDAGGNPLLHIAAKNGYNSIAEALLAKDSLDVNATDRNGATPLQLAAYHGNKGAVEALLTKDSLDISKAGQYQNKLGTIVQATAADIATDNKHPEIATLIADKVTANEQLASLINRDYSTPTAPVPTQPEATAAPAPAPAKPDEKAKAQEQAQAEAEQDFALNLASEKYVTALHGWNQQANKFANYTNMPTVLKELSDIDDKILRPANDDGTGISNDDIKKSLKVLKDDPNIGAYIDAAREVRSTGANLSHNLKENPRYKNDQKAQDAYKKALLEAPELLDDTLDPAATVKSAVAKLNAVPNDSYRFVDPKEIPGDELAKAMHAVDHKAWEKSKDKDPTKEPKIEAYQEYAKKPTKDALFSYGSEGSPTDAEYGKKVGAVLLQIEKDREKANNGAPRPDVIVKGSDGTDYRLEPKEFSAYLQRDEDLPVDKWVEKHNIGLTSLAEKPDHKFTNDKGDDKETIVFETGDGQRRVVGNGVITQPLKGYYGGVEGVTVGDNDKLDIYVSPDVMNALDRQHPTPYKGDVYVMQQMKDGKPDELKVGYAKDVDEFRDMQASTWDNPLDFVGKNQGQYVKLSHDQYKEMKQAIQKNPNLTLDKFLEEQKAKGVKVGKGEAIEPVEPTPLQATPDLVTGPPAPEKDKGLDRGAAQPEAPALDAPHLQAIIDRRGMITLDKHHKGRDENRKPVDEATALEVQEALVKSGVAVVITKEDPKAYAEAKKAYIEARDKSKDGVVTDAAGRIVFLEEDLGHYGKQTDAAVAKLQQTLGFLNPDHNLGRATAVVLREAMYGNAILDEAGKPIPGSIEVAQKVVHDELLDEVRSPGLDKREKNALNPKDASALEPTPGNLPQAKQPQPGTPVPNGP